MEADAVVIAIVHLFIRTMAFDRQRITTIQPVLEPTVGLMRMYNYDMTRVLAIFTAAGFEKLWLEHINHAGHHAFQIVAKKTQ